MIGFIVPLKPKTVSKNWALDSRLLERTLRSICNQTNKNFKVILVFNDRPETEFTHPNLIYHYFPFDPVSSDEIEDLDYVLKYYSRDYAEKMLDKGKKTFYGCKKAIEIGCEYLMGVDGDDLISNQIAAFVNDRISSKSAGWRIKKGFIYEENSTILIKNFEIQDINGSTHIIRKDLIKIPDFSTNVLWNYNLFEAHGYTYDRIRQFHNVMLDDYPSFGVIYMIHHNNTSNIRLFTQRISLKNFVKKILRGKWLNNKIRSEFNFQRVE